MSQQVFYHQYSKKQKHASKASYHVYIQLVDNIEADVTVQTNSPSPVKKEKKMSKHQ